MTKVEFAQLILLDEYLKRKSEYEYVEALQSILYVLGMYTTDDHIIEALEGAEKVMTDWLDNYDPTPWIAETKQ